MARAPNQPLFIYPVTLVGCFCVLGEVGGEPISFPLDTGAAVTLLSRDIWRRLTLKRSAKLVGVDGSPLQVHGQVNITVMIQGKPPEIEALVVSPLTKEGILGLDFLRKHEGTTDVVVSQWPRYIGNLLLGRKIALID